jgi:hypothetical protein
MGMSDADQAAADWRKCLREMRTLGALRRPALDEADIRQLSDRALHAAAHNPDHSQAAREAAAGELRARGADAGPWRLSVPGFIRPADLARGERLFFGFGHRLRKWSGAGTYLSLLAVFVTAFVSVPATEDALREAEARGLEGASTLSAPDFLWSDAEAAPLRELLSGYPAFERAALAEQIGFWFALAFGVLLLVWLIASWLRRKPARLLLLRKFNVRDVSGPLERMLMQELRPYGHIATLSDKFIRRDTWGWLQHALLAFGNPLAALWLILGTPIRFVYRLFDRSTMGPAVVLNARDYRNLARRLRDRLGLNMQVATVRKEAFTVRTSDAWWRMVVRLFMDSSDAIVVDLSQISAGTDWELDVIKQEGVAARCVFVSIWGKLEEAEAALASRGIDAPVYHYAPDGEMQRRGPFRAAMLAAMRVTHGAPT